MVIANAPGPAARAGQELRALEGRTIDDLFEKLSTDGAFVITTPDEEENQLKEC